MRLLIISTGQRLAGYVEFAEDMRSLRAETLCVHDLKYCFLGRSKPLHIVPVPRLLELVKRFDPDFVMTDSPYYIPQMLKLVSRRVLFHMRGAEEGDLGERRWDMALYPSLFARVYTRYLAEIIDPCINKADLILPNCRWLENQVKKRFPNHQTQVLYAGIDPEKWVPTHNSTFDFKQPAVVSVFQFDIYAKVLGLLKFIRVAKEMPDVNFYLAGDGPYLNMVKQQCPSNMFLLGRVSQSEVKVLLESGKVFVHPSGLDALPRSVKEASLMEKPIIASNVGGIPEIVKNGKTGYLCEIDDVDQWFEKIRFLLENPDAAKKLGENAREYVTKMFGRREVAENFLQSLKLFREHAS